MFDLTSVPNIALSFGHHGEDSIPTQAIQSDNNLIPGEVGHWNTTSSTIAPGERMMTSSAW